MQIINQMMDVEVLGMPIGQAALLTAAFGLSDGLATLVNRLSMGYIPTGLAPATVALAINNIRPLKTKLSPEVVNLLSLASLTASINSQFNVTGMVRSGVDKLVSFIPGMSPALPKPAATTTTTTTESMSGYALGNPSMGAAPAGGANMDDVDMSILNSRGYQVR